MSYKVKQEDLIGDIKYFPIEVVQAMVDEQERQYGTDDVTVFQISSRSGFRWNKSKEGRDFWNEVTSGENFDLFFEKYPKQQEKQQELVPEVEGVMMEVSDDGVEWHKRLVLCKYAGVFHSEVSVWKHARPIQKPVKEDYLFKLTPE